MSIEEAVKKDLGEEIAERTMRILLLTEKYLSNTESSVQSDGVLANVVEANMDVLLGMPSGTALEVTIAKLDDMHEGFIVRPLLRRMEGLMAIYGISLAKRIIPTVYNEIDAFFQSPGALQEDVWIVYRIGLASLVDMLIMHPDLVKLHAEDVYVPLFTRAVSTVEDLTSAKQTKRLLLSRHVIMRQLTKLCLKTSDTVAEIHEFEQTIGEDEEKWVVTRVSRAVAAIISPEPASADCRDYTFGFLQLAATLSSHTRWMASHVVANLVITCLLLNKGSKADVEAKARVSHLAATGLGHLTTRPGDMASFDFWSSCLRHIVALLVLAASDHPQLFEQCGFAKHLTSVAEAIRSEKAKTELVHFVRFACVRMTTTTTANSQTTTTTPPPSSSSGRLGGDSASNRVRLALEKVVAGLGVTTTTTTESANPFDDPANELYRAMEASFLDVRRSIEVAKEAEAGSDDSESG
eukprot:GHVU01068971.1.p1 GENE.GHVU01068971.1~~GHVU01068971.1.p1  ORF type:complete len:466 (+),score=93.79 GHVU01068971.1:972-2369(+)